METGEIGIIIAIFIGAGAIIWQSWAQGNKLDRKIDSVETRLDRKIESEADKLDRKIETEVNRLDRRIESIEDKVSDAALTAARNEGRYDVLTAHSHTHEPPSPSATAAD